MKTGDTRIELDRFIRYDSASQWRLLPGSSTSPSPLRIYIDSSLVEQYEITTITPEPARCRAGNSRIGAAFGHQVRGARAKRKDLDHPEQVAT
jgi:hypothetical protein